jgi:Leucine-rich repeat (LRR) protein
MKRVAEGRGRVFTDYSGSDWLRRSIGDERSKAFEHIETVRIYERMPDKDLAFIASHGVPHIEVGYSRPLTRKLGRQLARNPQLKTIAIYGDTMNRDFFEFLSQSQSLESISMSMGELDGDVLQPLAAMKSLKYIRISFELKGSTNLNVLHKLPGLTRLSFSVSKADRTDWERITALDRENLELILLRVNDEDLRMLSTMPRIDSLTMKDFTLTVEELKLLENMQGLKSLTLLNNQPIRRLTDEGLQILSNLQSLKSLTLNGGEFTDAGLPALYGLTNLESLHISGAHVTQSGIRDLKSHLPDTKIIYSKYYDW